MILAILPYPQIDPVLIQIGPIAVRWYALSYITGLLLGWWLIVRMLANKALWRSPIFKGKAPASADDIGDLFVWTTLGVIIGGRLGYDLFYGTIFCGTWSGRDCGDLPMGYLHNPLRLIAEWHSATVDLFGWSFHIWVPQLQGMSFHGGLCGVVVALVLFCRNRKLDVVQIGDLVALAAPIGLFFGRIANFINGELWGKPSSMPWAMVFPRADDQPRHPSQLYEAALEGLLLFGVLQICLRVFRLHNRPGLLTAIFFTGYGLARFFVEFFRDSESMISGWFSMGMALSFPMWAAAAFFFWYALKPRPKP
ncbi:MAG: prolipoprotein diacylglyceryl transferase [Rhizomicrobium sp.]